MARDMSMCEDDHVFRAVLTLKYRNSDEPVTRLEGPYTSAAAARARVTFWKNYLADRDLDIDGSQRGETWATGHVEFGVVTWKNLD